jgi:hypothetical protein
LYLADRLIVIGGTPATILETVVGVDDLRVAELRLRESFRLRINELRSTLRQHEQTGE